ncbi:MAG: AraC family transcriptional regulator [Candidatus Marinimicrobia bacterium]|nr:AraC family transcriptional regulator [Candidatus Neomarinimicrobiota bacterium]
MNLDRLPPDALRVEWFETGAFDRVVENRSHRKTCPYTILAQAVQGRYGIGIGQEPLLTLACGEAFLTGPNLPLHIAHHGDARHGNRMRARWIHLRITLFQSLDISNLLDLPRRVSARACQPFGEIIEELQRLNANPAQSLVAAARRQELAFRALGLLCRLAPFRKEAVELVRRRERLGPALALMRERLADSLSVADLARRAHLSVPQFHVFFRRLMGRTPMEHLKQMRLSEVCRLLVTDDAPLRWVAEQTGFCNEFHLSRVFRATYGKPPGVWRREQDCHLAFGSLASAAAE